MNKQYLSQRFIAIFMIMLLAIFQVVSFTPQNVEAASLENGATISAVDHNGEAVLPLTAVNIKEGQTAYDVLKEITEAKDIPLDAPIDPTYGPFINNIGNVTLPAGQYWTLSINGEPATVGADGYTVKNGDSLLFKVSGYPYEQVDVKVSALDQKGNKILDETVSVFKGSSGYDAVKLAGKLANVEIDASIDSTWFAFINNIGNTELGDTDYWSVYLNDISMMEGLSSYIPKSGDHIELRLPKVDDEGSGEGEEPDTGNEQPEEEKPNPEPIPVPQPEADPVTKETVNAAINQLADKYFTTNGIQDHMAAVALNIVGDELPKSYIEELKKEIIDRDGVYRNVTDYEKIVLSLTSANVDASSFVGYDLIEKIYNNDRMTIQGNNGVAYALIALDSGNYEIPSNAKWTREALVKYLLNEQLESGGWSLAPNSKESIDITAMILTALAPYQDQENVKSAINKAVEWIANEQDNDGGFSDEYNGGDASETTAQVIIGLTAVGVDPAGEQFTKQATVESSSKHINLIQHLLTFKQEDGGFAHLLADNESDYMASTQALLALLAYQDYLNEGKSSIYQFSQPDTEVVVPEEDSDNKVETPAPEAPVENNKPVPATDNEASNTDNSKVNQNEGNSNVELSQKTEGHQLPNTATPLYNLIVIGVVIAVIGTAVLIFTRRRSQNA
ncbi:hypothetical protein CHH83_00600 [Bacillus sp. 7586-K]|nr:hypothetical protein CHH83_00600 [Bacillus sp. 7586-K]